MIAFPRLLFRWTCTKQDLTPLIPKHPIVKPDPVLLKGSHDELKSEIQGVRTELKETREELREEMASGFNALVSKVEGHEDRIRFLERKVA